VKGAGVGVKGCIGCFGHEVAAERGDECRRCVGRGSRQRLFDLEVGLAGRMDEG
jgi:hypothetical protein